VLLSLCFLFYGGQWIALISFLPTFFIEEGGMSSAYAAFWTASAVLVNIIGNIFGGFLSILQIRSISVHPMGFLCKVPIQACSFQRLPWQQ
jgi:fucose permease